jgi:hypothetical protein
MSSPQVAPKTLAGNVSNVPNLTSIILSVGGIIMVTISMGIQFAVVNNGPSGDNMITSNWQGYVAPIITGVIILFVGLVMYKVINQQRDSFLWLFIFSMLSYFLANIAIMYSLYQVNLRQL